MQYMHTLGHLGQKVIKDRLVNGCGLPPRKAGSVLRVFNKWKREMEDGLLSSFDMSPEARRVLAGMKIDSVTDIQYRRLYEANWEKKLPAEVKPEITRLIINLGLDE